MQQASLDALPAAFPCKKHCTLQNRVHFTAAALLFVQKTCHLCMFRFSCPIGIARGIWPATIRRRLVTVRWLGRATETMAEADFRQRLPVRRCSTRLPDGEP